MICLLDRLSQIVDPNPCPALKVDAKNNILICDPSHFACCNTEGFFYQEFAGAAKRCSLKERLAQSGRIYQQFLTRWQTLCPIDKPVMTPPEAQFLARILKKRQTGETIKGRAFSTNTPNDKPSLKMWHWALFAAWRFGLPTYVLTLDERVDWQFHEKFLSIQDEKPIIFVEQKASLKSPQTLEAFSHLISWCEKREASLWLDLIKVTRTTEPTPSGIQTAKDKYAEKLAALKNQPPLNWLGPDAKSRLSAVCSDIQLFMSL